MVMLSQYTPRRDVGAVNIQFHSLNSAEHVNEWSPSHPSCFNHMQAASSHQEIEGWVGSRPGLDVWEKK